MRTSHVQEVAVVQGLQADVAELQVAVGVDGFGQAGQVEFGQFGVQQFGRDTFGDVLREVVTYSAAAACATSLPKTSLRMVCSSMRAVTCE
jgi:hypothetical protein